jgi:hypothetical protein
MKRHGIWQYCAVFGQHYLREIIPTILVLPAVRLLRGEPRRSIRIVDPTPVTRPLFNRLVGQAIDLIAERDPIWFTRVAAQVRVVVSAPGIVGSVYHHALRACALNVRSFTFNKGTEASVKYIASALIHDAASGHLMRHGVARTRRNRNRFDRFCQTRAHRFLLRLGMVGSDWSGEEELHLSFLERLRIWAIDGA